MYSPQARHTAPSPCSTNRCVSWSGQCPAMCAWPRASLMPAAPWQEAGQSGTIRRHDPESLGSKGKQQGSYLAGSPLPTVPQ